MNGTHDASPLALATPSGRRVLALALLALLALGAAACDQVQALIDPPPPQEAPKPEDNLPPAKVDLPPVPQDLGKHSTPETHPDGALTVAGLLRNRPKYLDKKVTVRGFITWIYDCPYDDDDPAKAKPAKRPKPKTDPEAEPKMCDRPHLLLADTAGEEERTLMIVGLTPELEEHIKTKAIAVGQEHTLDGTFLENAEGFTAADYGLVQVATIKGFEPKPPEEEDPAKKK